MARHRPPKIRFVPGPVLVRALSLAFGFLLVFHAAQAIEAPRARTPLPPLPAFTIESAAPDRLDGHPVLLLTLGVKDPGSIEALGYRRVRVWFDPVLQTIRQAAYFDAHGQSVWTIHIDQFNEVNHELHIGRAEVFDYRSGIETVLDQSPHGPSTVAQNSSGKFYF